MRVGTIQCTQDLGQPDSQRQRLFVLSPGAVLAIFPFHTSELYDLRHLDLILLSSPQGFQALITLPTKIVL